MFSTEQGSGEPEPPAVSEMKTKIITDLEKRFSEEKDAFMRRNKASYLDPRFHRLIRLKEEQRRQVKVALLEEMKQVNVAGGTCSEAAAKQPRDDQQPAEKTALTAMGCLFGDTYCTDRPGHQSAASKRDVDVRTRVSDTCSTKSSHVVELWEKPSHRPDDKEITFHRRILSPTFPLLGI